MSEVTIIGIDLVKRVFQLHGHGWTDPSRFARSCLLVSCRRLLLGIIRLDRLRHSLEEFLETVENPKEQDIELISLEERIDTTSAARELVFQFCRAIAHCERRLISESTKPSDFPQQGRLGL